MADLESSFCLVGRFIAFVPGEKSPYQMISLDVSLGDSSAEATHYRIVLDKHLRRMMYRYLNPQDWLKVVGHRAMNLRSGQLEWKAAEIFKLSAHQVSAYRVSAYQTSTHSLPAVTLAAKASAPVRVLICQASDCRQRGSEAVSRALKEAIAQANSSQANSSQTNSSQTNSSQKIMVQSTGCMKRCKEGPNVVTVPGGQHCQVSLEGAITLLQTLL
ncbi:MAG: hypothetical protein DCF25_02150 [Leptolyngbya foveolarum]|uniref:(Fe-S)-binding protein n=1 Tax=Leptolyngbya foveolarum TaxID=47253 RepID=A0A2W4UMU8_9CYAN|nr:MAG: hypothetical protein DCF25_02150 [Leptolyngbya foveolarum]